MLLSRLSSSQSPSPVATNGRQGSESPVAGRLNMPKQPAQSSSARQESVSPNTLRKVHELSSVPPRLPPKPGRILPPMMATPLRQRQHQPSMSSLSQPPVVASQLDTRETTLSSETVPAKIAAATTTAVSAAGLPARPHSGALAPTGTRHALPPRPQSEELATHTKPAKDSQLPTISKLPQLPSEPSDATLPQQIRAAASPTREQVPPQSTQVLRGSSAPADASKTSPIERLRQIRQSPDTPPLLSNFLQSIIEASSQGESSGQTEAVKAPDHTDGTVCDSPEAPMTLRIASEPLDVSGQGRMASPHQASPPAENQRVALGGPELAQEASLMIKTVAAQTDKGEATMASTSVSVAEAAVSSSAPQVCHDPECLSSSDESPPKDTSADAAQPSASKGESSGESEPKDEASRASEPNEIASEAVPITHGESVSRTFDESRVATEAATATDQTHDPSKDRTSDKENSVPTQAPPMFPEPACQPDKNFKEVQQPQPQPRPAVGSRENSEDEVEMASQVAESQNGTERLLGDAPLGSISQHDTESELAVSQHKTLPITPARCSPPQVPPSATLPFSLESPGHTQTSQTASHEGQIAQTDGSCPSPADTHSSAMQPELAVASQQSGDASPTPPPASSAAVHQASVRRTQLAIDSQKPPETYQYQDVDDSSISTPSQGEVGEDAVIAMSKRRVPVDVVEVSVPSTPVFSAARRRKRDAARSQSRSSSRTRGSDRKRARTGRETSSDSDSILSQTSLHRESRQCREALTESVGAEDSNEKHANSEASGSKMQLDNIVSSATAASASAAPRILLLNPALSTSDALIQASQLRRELEASRQEQAWLAQQNAGGSSQEDAASHGADQSSMMPDSTQSESWAEPRPLLQTAAEASSTSASEPARKKRPFGELVAQMLKDKKGHERRLQSVSSESAGLVDSTRAGGPAQEQIDRSEAEEEGMSLVMTNSSAAAPLPSPTSLADPVSARRESDSASCSPPRVLRPLPPHLQARLEALRAANRGKTRPPPPSREECLAEIARLKQLIVESSRKAAKRPR